MSQKFVVGISDWKICRNDDSLVTYALGSCVGICLYDRSTKLSGLSHIMLPDSKAITGGDTNRMKYADTAIPDMYKRMLLLGASKAFITAKIMGGALMFAVSNSSFNVGERNVAAVKAALSQIGVPIVAQDTGKNYGRTVNFFAEDGRAEITASTRETVTLR